MWQRHVHYHPFHSIHAWLSLDFLHSPIPPIKLHSSAHGLCSWNGKGKEACMYRYLGRIYCNLSPIYSSSQQLLILTWLSTMQSFVTFLFTGGDGIQTAWSDLLICQRHLPAGTMRHLIWWKLTVRAGSRVTLETAKMVSTRESSFTQCTTEEVFRSWGLPGTWNFPDFFPTVTLCRISHNSYF